jgi:hypothetical protein
MDNVPRIQLVESYDDIENMIWELSTKFLTMGILCSESAYRRALLISFHFDHRNWTRMFTTFDHL